MKINQALKKIYEPYFEELRLVSKKNADKFSYPLLMKAFDAYNLVEHKILFVGKETYGWISTMDNSKGLTVEYLMDSYEKFDLGNNYYNSPFWRFVKTFYQSINGKKYSNGFLWTNFSKCDSQKTTPNKELQKINNRGFELIKDEIQITKPDIILFLGWSGYEEQYEKVFDGIKYETIEENILYKCKHKLLPIDCYMTPHPKWLQIKNKFDSTIALILPRLISIAN